MKFLNGIWRTYRPLENDSRVVKDRLHPSKNLNSEDEGYGVPNEPPIDGFASRAEIGALPDTESSASDGDVQVWAPTALSRLASSWVMPTPEEALTVRPLHQRHAELIEVIAPAA
jgi:hypothetical protein